MVEILDDIHHHGGARQQLRNLISRHLSTRANLGPGQQGCGKLRYGDGECGSSSRHETAFPDCALVATLLVTI
jgi:hypothetical protein